MFRLLSVLLSLCLLTTHVHAQDDEFDDVDMDNIEAPVKKKPRRIKRKASEPAPISEMAAPTDSDESLLEESSAPPPDITPAPKKKVRRKKKTSTATASKRKVRTKRSGSAKSTFYHAGIGYSLGGTIKFSKVDHESTIQPGETTSASYKTGGAIEVSGGYMYMPQNAWGYGGTLSYQLARKISAIEIDGQTFTASGTSISTILLEGYGIYRFQEIYIPVGLNFGLPSYSGKSNGATTKVKGDIGVQVGVGIAPSAGGLFYEGQIKMIGIQAQTDAVTETYTYKTAYLMSLEAKVGYLF